MALMFEDRDAYAIAESKSKAVKAVAGLDPALTADYSFVLPALRRVPLMVILWPACEEVGGAVRMLFRRSAPYYLHSEDLAALGIVAAERLIKTMP
jgi:hypothetical protein